MKKTVTFEEYQKAKAEIIEGVEYKESTQQSDNGTWGKTYATEKNGAFYEVYDPISGLTEFYSSKYSESRYYDGRTREELIEQVETLKKELNHYCAEISRLTAKVIGTLELEKKELEERNKYLEEKWAAINAVTREVAA